MNKPLRFLMLLLAAVLAAISMIAGCAAQSTSPINMPYYDQPKYYESNEAPEYINPNSEEYGDFVENKYKKSTDEPLSTFSIDVDTASYSNIRRYINDDMLPPADAVRVEECINYFSYGYDAPSGDAPVTAGVVIGDCPWNAKHHLARISVKAQELDLRDAKDSNLVFLLDVSGSMSDADKLPLVKAAMMMLSENLRENDRISIVVYAGASGLVLDGCSGIQQMEVETALEQLSAGGSTAGGAGAGARIPDGRKALHEGRQQPRDTMYRRRL